MGSLSIWHWIIVIGVAAVLFGGRGKISGVMGDFAKGIKAFKSGMKEDDEPVTPPVQVTAPSAAAAPTPTAPAAAATVADRPREHA
jgi:sec-independent protein translocase protein TatA